MSAMVEMSKAIRETAQRYAPTLSELPDNVLFEFTQIVGAYYGNLQDARRRRESVTQVDPEFNPTAVMGPGDEVPRMATESELRAFQAEERIADLEDALCEIYWRGHDQESMESTIIGVLSPEQRIEWARRHLNVAFNREQS